jgi:hypothetical protein
MSRAISRAVLALLVFCTPLLAVDQGQLLPTGMRITERAAKGATMTPLNPGLAEFPNFVASMGVSSRVSPDGKTLPVVTAGYNQNYDSGGNTIADASNEYVFVYDISQQTDALGDRWGCFGNFQMNRVAGRDCSRPAL